MISAEEARKISKEADESSRNAWLQLEKNIREACKQAKRSTVFKTHQGMEFLEHRAEVAAKLRLWGFNVSYHKYEEDQGYVFGNVYEISW